MHLTHLKLVQFRCYSQVAITIPEAGLRMVGANASGKTSLLEAVGLLATTRSFRGAQDRDLVRWESGEEFGIAPFGRVEATVDTRHGRHELAVGIQLDEPGDSVAAKRFELDHQTTSAHKMVGHLTTVTFAPEDVQLVIGPPADRRRALDILISQIDRDYMQHLSRYARILRQRNGLLKAFARDRVSASASPAVTQIAYWDEQLVAEGGYLIAARVRTIDALNQALAHQSPQLHTGNPYMIRYDGRVEVNTAYLGQMESPGDAVVHANAMFQKELQRLRVEEFRRGMTLTGPHRDDVTFTLGDRSLARFGSRGQQRLGVLAFKLAEADVIAARTDDSPVFLLDDVLSELDVTHRNHLLGAISAHGSQVLITSAEPAMGGEAGLDQLGLFETPCGPEK